MRDILWLPTIVVALLLPIALAASPSETDEARPALDAAMEDLGHRLDVLEKKIDDVLWYERVGDVAVVDKVRIYGPPPWREDNPTAIGAGNHVKFYAYLFTPRGFDDAGRLPLLVLPHGGVHADFTTYYAHVVRELAAQGYVVVAPEYRGSTGYGRTHWEKIDYGGREVGDCLAARDWAAENHPRVDPDRVGILGWSHGGLIALMSLFDHPEAYSCAFAGVPVSDLVMRMGYWGPDYQAYYDAEHHIGQTPAENLEEYMRRSPVWNVDKLSKPLRIHTNPRDEDVNYIEVEHLIQALQAADKSFEHEVYEVPGGHSFDRLDTPEAWRIRREIYRFLARHLKPPRPDVQLGIQTDGHAAP
jgi:dipeptidyl aminopeptidase/acylaminoacyl peptidase